MTQNNPSKTVFLLNVETGSHELAILSYATVCLHPSVSLNNEKNCREISKDKIAVCEKTAGLRSGNSSDLDSACLKALVPVEIFQFSDMHYELSALKSWLQLILAKYDINGNYSQYIKATSTKLATIIVRPSVNKLQYFVAMETVT